MFSRGIASQLKNLTAKSANETFDANPLGAAASVALEFGVELWQIGARSETANPRGKRGAYFD